jgi:hypothetical protein
MADSFGEPNVPSPPRRRRSQSGKQSPMAHGFYARQFAPLERSDLQNLLVGDLHDEIAMLRVALRRVLDLSEGISDLAQAVRWLNTMSIASTRLASLLRTQRLLLGNDARIAETISQALSDVLKDFNLK